jgi:hypothetical protein
MKFYNPPVILCDICKGPAPVEKILFSASDKVCFVVECRKCRQKQDIVMSFARIVACYMKCEGKSDAIFVEHDDMVIQ